jgi:hypothetical protein
LGSTTSDQRHVLTGERVECFSRCGIDGHTLLMGQVNCFSIAAISDNTGYACLSESNGMSFCGGNVNFVAGVEESDGWDMDFQESVVM